MSHTHRFSFRPRLEVLEDRALPSGRPNIVGDFVPPGHMKAALVQEAEKLAESPGQVEAPPAAMAPPAAAPTHPVRLTFPGDFPGPPFYTSGAGPQLLADGTIGVIHTDEWVAIPFQRSPECVPADFNLLELLDPPRAFGCPLLVEGFAEFRDPSDPAPILAETRGLGAVPVWFVRWSEFQTATADRVLTIGELRSLPSLQIGTASFYQDQNHIFGAHQVSHQTIVARGTLADGRSFDLLAIEVALELVEVRIAFG